MRNLRLAHKLYIGTAIVLLLFMVSMLVVNIIYSGITFSLEQFLTHTLLSLGVFIVTMLIVTLIGRKFTKQLGILTDSVNRFTNKEFDIRAENC